MIFPFRSQLIRNLSLTRIDQMEISKQRQAPAELVGVISRLDATLHWGEGRTSASDGQRFAMPRKVLQQTFSTRCSDYALEFYSFIADNYAPFYSTPIECTDRDAAFVLDGLLYNASDLELEEHYTDTHGYTEINFAAFAMLGRRFCPRIRSVQHQRLYRIDRDRDYGVIGLSQPPRPPGVVAVNRASESSFNNRAPQLAHTSAGASSIVVTASMVRGEPPPLHPLSAEEP